MIEYQFDPKQKLLVVTLSGVVTAADFAEGLPDVPVGTRELLDTTGATTTDLKGAQVQHIAKADLARPDRISKMAILANTPLGFGLARMYQTLSDEMRTEVKIFREAGAARKWLEVP